VAADADRIKRMPPEQLQECVARALAPEHFFFKPPLALRVEQRPQDRRRWELFRGELLQPDQTRLEKSFHSWFLYLDDPERPALGPTLAVRWDRDEERLHVTRGFAVHGHQAYGKGNIVQTRPAIKWFEERVGTIDLGSADAIALMHQLARLLGSACTGTSRLPITSVESPLPVYAFGRFAFAGCTGVRSPLTTLREWLETGAAAPKAIDFALRTAEKNEVGIIADAVRCALDRYPQAARKCRQVLADLFHTLAFPPDSEFPQRVVALLKALHKTYDLRPTVRSYLLNLSRHLNAYDLMRFHNQGANYPDALFLDALLKLHLEMVGRGDDPRDLRALRAACVWRKKLEGLPVPDRPTSPGDLQRVWPPNMNYVPEEQLKPEGRTHRLFVDQPLECLLDDTTLDALHRSFYEDEPQLLLLELGRATFLDRPLGVFKSLRNWHRDQTPLVAYAAHSKTLCRQRLADAAAWGWITSKHCQQLQARVSELELLGISAEEMPLAQPRPGVISLEDARQAAPDFIFISITTSGWASLSRVLDFESVRQSDGGLSRFLALLRLIIRSPRRRLLAEPRAFLTAYDDQMQPRLELGLPQAIDICNLEYVERNGEEYLPCGLDVLHAWDEAGREIPLPAEPIHVASTC
jgi:hypothetical protein